MPVHRSETFVMRHHFPDIVTQQLPHATWRTDGDVIHMQSQVWQGQPWNHAIRVVKPSWTSAAHVCYLEVTGTDAGSPDAEYARALAEASGATVAFLFDIPNQPLWNMTEDDLIAHTFEEYIASGDPEWPLLVPMVRSVIAAIDTLVEWSVGRFTTFVVGGASKRGWTSWLTATLQDNRVKGIVPLVFDNLNMNVQMRRQQELWGEHSPMIQDYTRRRLTELAQEPSGEGLVSLVDPFTNIGEIRCPVLTVNGSNDPYWAVDALKHYYQRLPAGSACQVVPNLGHSIGEWDYRLSTVGAFIRRCAGAEMFPRVRFDWGQSSAHLEIQAESDLRPTKFRVWGAVSENNWFAESEFFVDILPGPEVRVPARGNYSQAIFMELEYAGEHGPIRVTSPALILPRTE